jgi:hypothetical protein
MHFNAELMGPLIKKNFRGRDRRVLVDKAINVIFEMAEFWPLTVRQVFYQLVAGLIIENSQNRYQSVSRLVTKLRRLGILSWECIQDRTRRLTDKRGFEDAGTFLRQQLTELSSMYDRCLVQNQGNYVEIFTEKDALTGIIEEVSWIYCVRIVVCKGQISSTFLNDYAARARKAIRHGQNPVILYFGDQDPTGARIPVAIKQNLLKYHNLDIHLDRIALNMNQVEEYQLPQSIDAIKTKDPNYKWYVKQFGDIAVELDALHPEKLQELVKYGLGLYLDIEDMQQQQRIEGRERDKLKGFEQRVLDMARKEGLIN